MRPLWPEVFGKAHPPPPPPMLVPRASLREMGPAWDEPPGGPKRQIVVNNITLESAALPSGKDAQPRCALLITISLAACSDPPAHCPALL
eukprot:7176618-Pyramimonas_sp.AAC.1